VSVAVLDVPPYVPVIVTGVLDATTLVAAANVALVAPAATVTLAGTVAVEVLLLDSVTCAPPVGAAADKVTVPVEPFPPTTVEGLMLTDDSVDGPLAAAGVKLRADDHAPAVPAELRPLTRHQTCWPPVSPLSVACEVVTVGFATNGEAMVDELSTWTS
jgi:hypothetical protein